MRPEPRHLPESAISSDTPPLLTLHAYRHAMTLEDVFEDGALSALKFKLQKGWIVRVMALDGSCWATVVGKTENNRLILEPDAPVRRPEPRQKRAMAA